jgi:hypothetical protein
MLSIPDRNVLTPLGPAVCVGVVCDSEIVEWITFIKATGEPWFWRNQYIRLDPEVTSGRPGVSPFPPLSKGLQAHVERYKQNGWLP